MGNVISCKHCGSISVYFNENGPHISCYCSACGRFIKHVSKKELGLVNVNVNDSADYIPDYVPEENEILIADVIKQFVKNIHKELHHRFNNNVIHAHNIVDEETDKLLNMIYKNKLNDYMN